MQNLVSRVTGLRGFKWDASLDWISRDTINHPFFFQSSAPRWKATKSSSIGPKTTCAVAQFAVMKTTPIIYKSLKKMFKFVYPIN